MEIERQRKRKRDRERELDRESSEKETESEKESPLLSPVIGPDFHAEALKLLSTFQPPSPSPCLPLVPLFLVSPPDHQPSFDSPAFARHQDLCLVDPALSLSIAAAKRKPLPPQLLFESVPDMVDFLDPLTGSINLSMSHSFGVDFWRSESASTWKLIREEATLSILDALENPTELAIFQACSDLLLAPSRFLSFLGFVRPSLPAKPTGNSNTVATKLASEAIKRGQSGDRSAAYPHWYWSGPSHF